MAQKLSLKERRFLDAYLGTANGNATVAVLWAGYTRNRKSAAVLGVRLLGKVKIRTVIQQRTKREGAESIASADERDKRLSKILRESDAEHSVIAAARELNVCSGRHSIKHVMDVTERLADIIGAAVERHAGK